MSQPEGTFVDVGGGHRIHLHDLGEGTPVVFLHGSGPGASGWSNFAENAAYLVERGFRCLLIDSLGYGLSSKPTDQPYTLPNMVEAALTALDAVGVGRFVAVGNSQGGAQAIRMAVEHPDRVEKLVLMAPGGLEARETYMAMRGIRSMLRCVFGPDGLTLDGMQRVFAKQVHDPACLPEGVVAERFAVAETQPRHVFETMRVDNQEERLAEIRCPTLGLWGMNDLFCPPSGAEKLATRIADCRVVLVNRCGHWVMVEHRALFDRTVHDFLVHG